MNKIEEHTQDYHKAQGVEFDEEKIREKTKKVKFKKINADVWIGYHPENPGLLFFSIQFQEKRVKVAVRTIVLHEDNKGEAWDEQHQEVED